MSNPVTVSGLCDPRFHSVQEAFQSNFDQGREVGASFSAYLDGKCVVDIHAGHTDAECSRPWTGETLVNTYSTTKTIAALCCLILMDRGEIDADARVTHYWPEYGQSGKEGTLFKHLLAHSSGVAGFGEPIDLETLYDWERSTSLLARQTPFWEPGTASGYQAITHGHLLGEVIRRVTGQSLGTFFRREVAEPLQIDFHIGLPQEHDDRVAALVPPPDGGAPMASMIEPESIAAKALMNPLISPANTRDPSWLRAEIPAANGQGNAHAVARAMSVLAAGGELDGKRLLSAEGAARILEQQRYERDRVLGMPIRWGLGFGLTSNEIPLGPNPRAFFWGGWGGSIVVVDMDLNLSFAYVMNQMTSTLTGDPRSMSLAMSTFQSAFMARMAS